MWPFEMTQRRLALNRIASIGSFASRTTRLAIFPTARPRPDPCRTEARPDRRSRDGGKRLVQGTETRLSTCGQQARFERRLGLGASDIRAL